MRRRIFEFSLCMRIESLDHARQLDAADPLAAWRKEFHLPLHEGRESVYFTGNSLGAMPKKVRAYLETELHAWQTYGVEGHFKGEHPWKDYHHLFTHAAARLVGAEPGEVVVMNNLTVNLHLLMASFYRPEGKRNIILCEGGAFPSDQYALETQARWHQLNPDEVVVELVPRAGEHTLRTEDILTKIAELSDRLALVMMGGVNYYTGQFFDLEAITHAAHAVGALAGFDLAHAAGNVPLYLHNWEVDFACWCTYKYLNSGPGGTSGVFVHSKHGDNPNTFRLAGWWGHHEGERFLMKKGFKPMSGAAGWQLSNAQVLSMAAHLASLEIFDAVGMEQLRAKSFKLTAAAEAALMELNTRYPQAGFRLITPQDPQARGCQLSILCGSNGKALFQHLENKGVVADWREPNVIRIAPVPLYNSFEDVWQFASIMEEGLQLLA